MVKGKEKQKKNNSTVTPKKVVKKAIKSKMLSQVKTPEALKIKKDLSHVKKKPVKSIDKMAKGEKQKMKMKGLSQVKTPEALKTKKDTVTAKRKAPVKQGRNTNAISRGAGFKISKQVSKKQWIGVLVLLCFVVIVPL